MSMSKPRKEGTRDGIEKEVYTSIYVGNLPTRMSKSALIKLMETCGALLYADLKVPLGAPINSTFAFVEFMTESGATKAVNDLNGHEIEKGRRIRVEYPEGLEPVGCQRGGKDRRSHYVGRRSMHRVYVSQIPPNATWQDLKDHMRSAGSGSVCYAMIVKQGHGLVEFSRVSDMYAAMQTLDGSLLKSHTGLTSRIRITRHATFDHKRGGSGPQDRKRSRSRSRSPGKKRSRRHHNSGYGDNFSRRPWYENN